jgi:xylan 1,4-beta-xylosidase
MARAQNPVLPGFHPDPSILRVGEEYFIANSTFEWFPGVELHRSKDLVNWERLPSPLSGARLLDMEGCLPSCGIWAPCLSHSDGLFWLIFTNVRSWASGPWKDTPNYLTTAPSIEGPWSDPVFLNCSGFDPSLFHDDDGRKWFVNMEWDYRKTGSKQFSGILLQEYKPSEKRLVGRSRRYTPAPRSGWWRTHLYKRDGFFYVTAAEGGTGYEHAFTVARSRKIDGPYEFHPHNPLITSYGHPRSSCKKQATRAGAIPGWPKLSRLPLRAPLPGTDRCVLGRETSIVELEWKDGWPYLKPPAGAISFGRAWCGTGPTTGLTRPCGQRPRRTRRGAFRTPFRRRRASRWT